jgi:hypothetical protein
LRAGRRKLPRGSSLGELIARRRKVRNNTNIPRLNFKQVLVWADAHYKRTGRWPTRTAGRIREAPAETWYAVDAAFVQGYRGLSGFDSLACFLASKRGVRNVQALPDLAAPQVIAWATAFRKRATGIPKGKSMPAIQVVSLFHLSSPRSHALYSASGRMPFAPNSRNRSTQSESPSNLHSASVSGLPFFGELVKSSP